jgi:hypothetical protein
MPRPDRMTYGGAVHSRLTDLEVALIPFGLGVFGPGPQGTDLSLPLSAAMSVSLYWRRRSPLGALLACFAVGLVQLSIAFAGGIVSRAAWLLRRRDHHRDLLGLMGAVAGVAFGVGFGWATGRAFLRADGGPASYPVLQIAGYVALAGVAALLASVIPARRAARLTDIDGLAAE